MEVAAKVLLFLSASLLLVGTVESQGSSKITYTVEAYKFNQEWIFTPNKLSGCLLKEMNPSMLEFICSEIPSKTELLQGWARLENGTSGLEYLDLSCNLDSSLEESCVCGLLTRLEVLDMLSKSSDSQLSSYVLHESGYTYETWSCSHSTHITYKELETFSEATVISLSSPSIHNYSLSSLNTDNSGIILFQKAELLIVNNGLSMDTYTFGHNGLCALHSLQTIIVQNSIRGQKFPTEWFVPDLSSTPSCFKVQRIQVLHNQIINLQDTILPSVNWLRSLQLRHNSIETVHERAFHGLTYLQELSLQNNSISFLPGDVFQPLLYVNFIDLSYNKLYTFNATSIRNITTLIHLELTHNMLFTIEGRFKVAPLLVYLNISYNFLPFLDNETYSYCEQMGILKLDHNNISTIQDGAFKGLFFVKFLGLSYNQIYDADNLRQNMWYNMEFLQLLNLDHNNLTELLPMQFQRPPYASQLVYVDVKNNHIRNIDVDTFKYLDSIRYLYLGYNPLSNFSFEVFKYLPNLQELSLSNTNLVECPMDLLPTYLVWLFLSENQLQSVPKVNKTMPYLMVLSLAQNNISQISEEDFSNFPLLVGMNLTRNSLTNLSSYTFRHLDRLVVLDLSHNQLDLDFSQDIFFGLVSLQQLFLDHNDIHSLDNLFQHNVNNINDVDLSYNPIQYFPDQPKVIGGGQVMVTISRLLLRGCNISSIHEGAFENAFDLSVLDLSNNLLSEFRPPRISALSEKYNVDLSGNPIKCSCNMKWLLSDDYKNHYFVDHCQDQFTKSIVPFHNLGAQDFLCENPAGAQCLLDQKQCTCYTDDPVNKHTTMVDCSNKSLQIVPSPIPSTTLVLHLEGNSFETLDFHSVKTIMKTERLFLQNSEISNIDQNSFTKFPYLKELNMGENDIEYMPIGLFRLLNKVTTLSLHSNKVSYLAEGTFEGLISLEGLYLHDNLLESFNASILKEIGAMQYLTHLSLGDNPWTCQCDNVTFKSWLQEHSDIILNLSSITCNDTAIINIPDEDLLCYDNTRLVIQQQTDMITVALTSSFALVALLMLVTLIVVYRHRFIIEVLIYNRFNLRFTNKENPDCIYDSFCIYDNELYTIRQWVRTKLLRELEPTFKLCVPDRDILAGTVWSDAIIEHIEKSRRSIVVLSSTGMENEKLLFTFQSAYYRMKFEDPTHRICVILLSDADKSDLISSDLTDPHLKAMLQTGQYINEDDKYVWEKLRYYMPKPGKELKESVSLHTVSTTAERNDVTEVGKCQEYGTIALSIESLQSHKGSKTHPIPDITRI